MTNTDRFDELIDDWARGRLGVQERAEFDAMLAADAALRAEAEDHRRVLAIVASERPAKAPAGLVAAAMARARAEAAQAPAAKIVDVAPSARADRAGSSRVLWFAAAAALAVMVGGYAVLRPANENASSRIDGADMAAATEAKRPAPPASGEPRQAESFAYDPAPDTTSQGDVARIASADGGETDAATKLNFEGGDAVKEFHGRAKPDTVASVPSAFREAEAPPRGTASASDIREQDSTARQVFYSTDSEATQLAALPEVAPAAAPLGVPAEMTLVPDADVQAEAPVIAVAQAVESAAPAAVEIAEESAPVELAMVAPTPAAPRQVERPRVESRVAPIDRPAGAVSNRSAADASANEARRAVDEPRAKVRDISPTPVADAIASLAATAKSTSEPRMSPADVVPIEGDVVSFFERQTQRAGGNVVAFADPKVFAADFPNRQALDSFLRMLEVVPLSVDRSAESKVAAPAAQSTPVVARGLAAKDNGGNARYSFNDGGRMFGMDSRKSQPLPARGLAESSSGKAARKAEAAPKTTMLDLDDYIVETVSGGESGRLMLLIRRKDAAVETHSVPARIQQQ